MNNENNKFYTTASIRRAIEHINQIFENFCQEIDSLKSEQTEIIKEILARVDKEKMEKILKEIR